MENFEYREFKVTPVVSQELVLRDMINQAKNEISAMTVEMRWYESHIIKHPKDTNILRVVADKKQKINTKGEYIAFLEGWLAAVEKGEKFEIGSVEAPAPVAGGAVAE